MKQVTLKAKKRENKGSTFSNRCRREGRVPGVVYGKDFENVLITIDKTELQKTLTSKAGIRIIINLDIEGAEKITTMVTDVQKDVYQKHYYHVDFKKISMDEMVHTDIPVVLIGEAKGVKMGGIMDHLLWNVPVKALPLDIPEKIEVDITEMQEGQHLSVKDLMVNAKVEMLLDGNETVAVIHPSKVSSAEGAAAEEKVPAKA